MKLDLEKSSQKPGIERAEVCLFHLMNLLLWSPVVNQSEQTLFVRALTCKQYQRQDAWHRLAMLMESDIEFTNSDKGTQIAFSPKAQGLSEKQMRGPCCN